MHVVRQRFARRRVGSDQIGGCVRIIRLKRHDTEPEGRETKRTGGRYRRCQRSCIIYCGRRVGRVWKTEPSSRYKWQDVGSASGQGRLDCGSATGNRRCFGPATGGATTSGRQGFRSALGRYGYRPGDATQQQKKECQTEVPLPKCARRGEITRACPSAAHHSHDLGNNNNTRKSQNVRPPSYRSY